MKLIKRRGVDIRGVIFDDVTLASATDAVIAHAESGEGLAAVYTPNSEIVQRCVEDGSGELYEIINSASLIIPDSSGIVKAAKLFGTPLSGKVAGVELGEAVLAEAASKRIPVFFLGGKPGVAEEARRRMTEKYPGLDIVGCGDGYFDKDGAESGLVIDRIAASGARILFVCFGAPAQERWIWKNRARLDACGVKVALALGGSLDIYAGTAKRAPRLFVKLGLEWLYRLIREPSRIGRMTALPRFWIGCRRQAANSKKRKT